jgi:thiamine-phosphate pyrophosphorylase
MTVAAVRLIVITDTDRAPVEVWLGQLARLSEAARPGTLQVQLRDRQLPIRERLGFGLELRQLTRRHGQRLMVNDRLDLAVLVEADGVHLAHASVEPADARAFGARHGLRWCISAACHEPEALAEAAADALLLSPVAQARKGRPALGIGGLTRALLARRQRSAPLGACGVYALGGVTRQNARALLDAGADGVALIGDALDRAGPSELLCALGIER